jgi:hypothetical protein
VVAWLRLCARELELSLCSLFVHGGPQPKLRLDRQGSVFSAPVFEWPPTCVLAAPDGFTDKVMARVRALPNPTPASRRTVAASYASSTGTSSSHPMRMLLVAFSIVTVLLGSGFVVTALDPPLGVLLLALLVNLLLSALNAVQSSADVINAATSNAWISIPLLASLLGAVLLICSLLARLIELPVMEA